MKEFKQLKFPNTKQGQENKIKALEEYSADGWHVVSETITQGKFNGGQACCLFLIFAPCAFLAGSSNAEINVTLEREMTEERKKQKEAEVADNNVKQMKSFKLQKGQEKILLWVIISVMFLSVIVALFGGSFVPAIGYFLVAIILLPATENFLKKKYKFNLSTKIKIISIVCIFALLLVFSIVSTKDQNINDNSAQPSAQVKTPEMIKAEQEAQAKATAEQAKADAEWKASKAGQICQNNPTWEKSDCENLADKKIWIGMTLDMLKYLRGTPNSANPSNLGSGNLWQWCWDDYTPSCFYGGDDGVITSYN